MAHLLLSYKAVILRYDQDYEILICLQNVNRLY